jgi:hypothetical protein
MIFIRKVEPTFRDQALMAGEIHGMAPIMRSIVKKARMRKAHGIDETGADDESRKGGFQNLDAG